MKRPQLLQWTWTDWLTSIVLALFVALLVLGVVSWLTFHGDKPWAGG